MRRRENYSHGSMRGHQGPEASYNCGWQHGMPEVSHMRFHVIDITSPHGVEKLDAETSECF